MVVGEISVSSAAIRHGAGFRKQQEQEHQQRREAALHPLVAGHKGHTCLQTGHHLGPKQQQQRLLLRRSQRSRPQELEPKPPPGIDERSPDQGQAELLCSKLCSLHCAGGDADEINAQKTEIQKLMKQNSEIIRLNTVRALQYRKCENERLQLASENLELRTKMASIRERLLDEERKTRLVEAIQLTRENTRWTLSSLINQIRHAANCIEDDVEVMSNALVYEDALEERSGEADNTGDLIGSAQRCSRSVEASLHNRRWHPAEFPAQLDARKRTVGENTTQSQQPNGEDKQSKLEAILEERHDADDARDPSCDDEPTGVPAQHFSDIQNWKRQQQLPSPPPTGGEASSESAHLLLDHNASALSPSREKETSRTGVSRMPRSPDSPLKQVTVDPGPSSGIGASGRRTRHPPVNYTLPSIRSKLRKGDTFTFTLPESTFASHAAATSDAPDARAYRTQTAKATDRSRRDRESTGRDTGHHG